MNTFFELANKIITQMAPEAELVDFHNQYTYIVSVNNIVEIAKELKHNPELKFNQLVDITAIDQYETEEKRYEIVYFFYSIENKENIRLKIKLENNEKPTAPTLTGVYKSADWYERETYDMYGVIFENHPDLRRFFMTDDFTDPITNEPLYPLRKDFPLRGIENSLPLPAFPEKTHM